MDGVERNSGMLKRCTTQAAHHGGGRLGTSRPLCSGVRAASGPASITHVRPQDEHRQCSHRLLALLNSSQSDDGE
jgi:hypothetical protein